MLDGEVELLDPNYPNIYVLFSTSQVCEPFCPYFFVEYWDNSICYPCTYPEECCNIWESFPERFLNENCEISPYSYLQFHIYSMGYANDCGNSDSDATDATITFRLGCTEVCVPGAWYPVYSDPVTISEPINSQVVMSLGGCGCEPLLPF